MAENKYWFARRFPLGDRRNAMSPIAPEGYRIVWIFVAWMIGGAIAAGVVLAVSVLWMPFLGVLAPFIFIGCTIYGAWYFITQAKKRGDQQHTVDDYRQGRVKPTATSAT